MDYCLSVKLKSRNMNLALEGKIKVSQKEKFITYIFYNITQPAYIYCAELKYLMLIYLDSCGYTSHN